MVGEDVWSAVPTEGERGKIGRLKLAECEKEKWRKLLDITARPLWSVGSAHVLHQTGLE